jgi:hypothetical protein
MRRFTWKLAPNSSDGNRLGFVFAAPQPRVLPSAVFLGRESR